MRLFHSSLNTGAFIPPVIESKAGLVMSFDDLYVDDWIEYHDTYGKQRGWRASFMANVGYPNQMDKLKYLYDEGHEIANHTNNGFSDPEKFINEPGESPETYYNTYVKTFEDSIISYGMPKPTSFRFPRNRLSTDVTNDLLNNRGYKIVTPASRGSLQSPIGDTNIYYNFDRYPIALDYVVVGTQPEFEALMDYALENKLVLNFFAHGIMNYYQRTNDIIDYANAIGLPMLHVSEMYDIPGSIPPDGEDPVIGTLTIDSLNSSQVFVSCSATDNIKVVGFNVWENGLNLYPRYESVLVNHPLNIVSGEAYTFELQAFDKAGNVSLKSNTISFTAP